MKRPSNHVIGFIVAIASTFVFWIGWLLIYTMTQSPEVEREEDYQSQLIERQDLSVKSKLKIAS